jgi:hypothetical protein
MRAFASFGVVTKRQRGLPSSASGESEGLLYVLSARGEMAWHTFKEVFETLFLKLPDGRVSGVRDAKFRRIQTRRALDALGHCDFSFNAGRNRVVVAPAVLARLPTSGLPEAVLAGSRSPGTVSRLRAAAKDQDALVSVEPQKDLVLVPPRVAVQTPTVEDMKSVATELGIGFTETPSAWTLLHASTSLDSALSACHWQPEASLNWRRKDFDPTALQFTARASAAEPARLVRYTDPKRQTRRHYFSKGGQWALIDREWGCYAALRAWDLNVLAYDRRQFNMAVPASAPLPPLLARSLALCSGFAPTFLPASLASWHGPERRGFDVYRLIPPQIAEAVASKLGQALAAKEITV